MSATAPSSIGPVWNERVVVTLHALYRARERCADLAGLPNRRLSTVIYHDVCAALAEGRKAKRQPAWAITDARTRGRVRGSGTYRYVWNYDETRAYVVAFDARGCTVLTVLSRRET